MASSLIVVIAQRLVRRVCDECKEELAPDSENVRRLKAIGLTPDQLQDGTLWIGSGCPTCYNTGYTDRIGIYEILPIDDVVKEQIVDRKSSTVIKRTSLERGCRTLRMDGAQKVLHGLTTPEEVLRVTQLDAF